MDARRRAILAAGAAGVLAAAAGCASSVRADRKSRVVVVGGGYGGATAAKYLRLLDPSIDVVLVEPREAFVACPGSNRVIGGFRTLADITTSYTALERSHGVRVVRDRASAIDAARREVRLERGASIGFDRAIVSPGIEPMWGEIPALQDPAVRARVPVAWEAGPQTLELRRRLEAMPDGGTFVIAIPETPFRCAPAPYERACQAAAYFQRAKPRARIVIADANGEIASEAGLFHRAWSELYAGMIDYRPNSRAVDVDVATGTVKLELEDVKGDVLNVLPPVKAAAVADPFITANGRWCEVDWLTYESVAARGVHILGDALQHAPVMAKSGHMANAQAKVCAAAVVALLRGNAPNASPTLGNACYTWFSDKLAAHVATVHKYDTAERTMKSVPGAGGVSPMMNERDALYAEEWTRNITADSFA
ncbi:MAG TPA: NAD(P)/FAD-dependent oxidoreductase [Usitatibacter sp.]|nr:NAD(P)/FAD-dependent oxidoreductase [Usitatibacter sp.]